MSKSRSENNIFKKNYGNTTFNIIAPYTYWTDNINNEFDNVDLIMEFNKKWKLTDINNFFKKYLQ